MIDASGRDDWVSLNLSAGAPARGSAGCVRFLSKRRSFARRVAGGSGAPVEGSAGGESLRLCRAGECDRVGLGLRCESGPGAEGFGGGTASLLGVLRARSRVAKPGRVFLVSSDTRER